MASVLVLAQVLAQDSTPRTGNPKHRSATANRLVEAVNPEAIMNADADKPLLDSPLKPIVKLVNPGVFQVGDVRLDQSRRMVKFPAVVNMTEGAVEYFLVTQWGKTHEAVLRTETKPYHIHVAMLLLGAKGAGTNGVPTDPSAPIKGERVEVTVRWQSAQGPMERRAEELLLRLPLNRVMRRGPWAYTGSSVDEAGFIAQREGQIIGLITDEYSLINNPREGRENDDIWRPNAKLLPKVGTEVKMAIQLLAEER